MSPELRRAFAREVFLRLDDIQYIHLTFLTGQRLFSHSLAKAEHISDDDAIKRRKERNSKVSCARPESWQCVCFTGEGVKRLEVQRH